MASFPYLLELQLSGDFRSIGRRPLKRAMAIWTCCMFFLRVLCLLTSFRERQRAKSSLRATLVIVGLPRPGRHTLCIPDKRLQPLVRVWALGTLSPFRRSLCHMYRELVQNLNIVIKPPRSWQRTLMNVQRFFKNLDWSTIDGMGASPKAAALAGHDLLRIPMNSITVKLVSIHRLQELVWDGCRDWFKWMFRGGSLSLSEVSFLCQRWHCVQ